MVPGEISIDWFMRPIRITSSPTLSWCPVTKICIGARFETAGFVCDNEPIIELRFPPFAACLRTVAIGFRSRKAANDRPA